ncbi:carbohydrate ABC transporter permease [Lichenihabitans sp. Uapishka_5]|uniref:carbohydrate ABC transporter permease n=1 Tax=Lichenihabitans sp. Uapishka_5 TaxID=3037302 RepID=UPI0029E7EAB4|nr:carbohydrate ABC transporter permease [Lichenihabitans sp. Uapishka_5]MDX7950050.1 carbohydrate ABC transporter permease [Lichenihabitans sp. Uapishka_5]
MQAKARDKALMTVLGWGVAFLVFFPVLWMALASFKTELDAVATPPKILFHPTLENYVTINERSDYLKFFINSVVESVGATLVCLLLAAPAAYAMAFFPTRKTKDILMWMLSTKMMPAVGVLVPIYLIGIRTHLLDTWAGMIIVFSLMNLPIVVWMLYSFFREVPKEILEAARMDGATPRQQLIELLLPLSLPGIFSTALLSIIICWNEAFWSINLTAANSAPLTQFIASFSSPEGLFWAKLSAASLLAIAPILVFGWLTQKQLVRGLTFGAVK